MDVSGGQSAAAPANFTGLEAVVHAFAAPVLNITATATHRLTGVRVRRSAAVQINFPPTASAPAPVLLTAPPGPLEAALTTVTLSTPVDAWSPFWGTGAPLVRPPLCTRRPFACPTGATVVGACPSAGGADSARLCAEPTVVGGQPTAVGR